MTKKILAALLLLCTYTVAEVQPLPDAPIPQPVQKNTFWTKEIKTEAGIFAAESQSKEILG